MAGFFGKMFDRAQEQGKRLSDAEIDAVFARAAEELKLKTEVHRNTWQQGDGGSWAADLDQGTIVFTNDKGWKITAPVQVIGTRNEKDGTWLWGWDHPSVPEPVAQHAELVQMFGQRNGLQALITRKIEASEDDAWAFTALACHLAQAQGGYRGPASTTTVFMTFGEVEISKA